MMETSLTLVQMMKILEIPEMTRSLTPAQSMNGQDLLKVNKKPSKHTTFAS